MAGEPLDTGIPQGILTTRGDLVVRGATSNVRLPLGADDRVLASDGTDPVWVYFPGYLDGLFGSTAGNMIVRGGSSWEGLPPGDAGEVLTAAGGAAVPTWEDPSSGGKPTTSGWTANTEVLSATKTLTNSDAALQFLDPGTTDRQVKLPAPSSSNPIFVIVNSALSSDAGLIITAPNGTWLTTGDTISPTQMAWCVSDGTRWMVSVGSTIITDSGKGHQVYYFGWSGTGTTFMESDEIGHAGAATTNDYEYEYTVGVGGTLAFYVFQVTNSTSNFQVDVLVNGSVADANIVVSSPTAYGSVYQKTVAGVATVNADDEIAIDIDTNTSTPGNTRAFIHLLTTTASRGFLLHWAAFHDQGGLFALPNGLRSTADTATANSVTEHMAISSTDVRFIWNTQSADSTTDVRIFKNGSAVDTIEIDGDKGSQATIGTSYTAGDQIAIDLNAGLDPDSAGYQIEFLDVRGQSRGIFVFAGDPSGSNNVYLNAFHLSSVGVSSTTHTVNSGIVLPFRVEVWGYTFNSTAATNAAASLRRNGSVVESITPGAAEATGSLTSAHFYKGDYMEMTANSSSGPTERYGIAYRLVRE